MTFVGLLSRFVHKALERLDSDEIQEMLLHPSNSLKLIGYYNDDESNVNRSLSLFSRNITLGHVTQARNGSLCREIQWTFDVVG